MADSKCSPWPWRLSRNMRGLNNARVRGVEDANGAPVANCGTGDVGWFNVRLIFAAPELADALEDMLYASDVADAHNGTQNIYSEAARAALAKIKGAKRHG